MRANTINTSQPTYDDILSQFQEIRLLMKELFISQKETDRIFQETDHKFQETSREIKAVNESIGRLGKSMLSIDDVDQHLIDLNKLKRMLPTYSEKKVMGAVAAMVLPDNVARYAYRQGLFVIAQSGDHLLIRNDAKFKPHIW